jgi:glutamate-1-semialdehyde 2,1-aminomutase
LTATQSPAGNWQDGREENIMSEKRRSIVERYIERTTKSEREWQQYRRVLPDGNTRALAFFEPHPVIISSGRGAHLTDLDGNRYFDLLNNYTSLVHGNAHPLLTRAAIEAIEGGTAFPAPHAAQARHAEIICERLEVAEMVRYMNSGTEAAMMAVRLARATTGRELVAKARFGYHGSWDGLETDRPTGAAATAGASRGGIPRQVSDLMRIFEFNDLEDLKRVATTAGSDLAAIILEPMLGSGGAVTASAEFLKEARSLASLLGAVFILDEVQTFRLAVGGLEEPYGLHPDIVVLGKLIGGGFPIGAVAGRRDLLEHFGHDSQSPVKHSGTYNGNLVSMSAGICSMELLSAAEIARINELGRTLADFFEKAISATGLSGCVSGYGSMFNVHLGQNLGTIERGSDVLQDDPRLHRLLHLALMNEGVFTAPRGFLNTSTALADDDLSVLEGAVTRALEAVAAEAADSSDHVAGSPRAG